MEHTTEHKQTHGESHTVIRLLHPQDEKLPSTQRTAYKIIGRLYQQLREVIQNWDFTDKNISLGLTGNQFFQECKIKIDESRRIRNEHKEEIVDEIERIERAIWEIVNMACELRVDEIKNYEVFKKLRDLIRESRLTWISGSFEHAEIPRLIIKRRTQIPHEPAATVTDFTDFTDFTDLKETIEAK